MRKHTYNFAAVAEKIEYFAPHIIYFMFCNQYSDFTTLNLCTKLKYTEHYFGLFMYSVSMQTDIYRMKRNLKLLPLRIN